MRLLVAGSGAVGASTALAALEAGIDTELIERRDDVCAGASKRAFGGIRQQFDDDAEIALAKASLAFFRTLPTSLFDPVGYLYLATNAACEATLRERYARQVRLGVACTWLDRDAVATVAPGVAVDDVRGALFGPEDGLAAPEAITRRLVARFVDLGGRLRTRTAVEDVVRGTDTVVVACGSETPAILARLAAHGHCGGLPILPIRPLVRSLVETDAVASPPRLPLVIEAHDGFHFRTRGDGLRLAMADDPPRWADSTDPAPEAPEDFGILPLARLKRRFPAAATAEIVRRWAGLYDVTPDARPIVDRLDARVFVAAGWSGHGFMTSPAVGRALADWVASGTRPAVFEGFGAARFASAIPDVWPTLL